jgi:UDPglucose 6-dehydrogenase
MAEKLGLGYDLFDSIMEAREIQAKNMATRLVELSKKYDLPIVILGKSYKPDVEYLDGSSSILVSHYIETLGLKVDFDIETPITAIYLLAHFNKFHEYSFPKGSVIVDPWRKFYSEENLVVHYGNTRIN